MSGRYAVVMNTSPLGQASFVFWQVSFGVPYVFETRADAHRVFKDCCETQGFKGPAGQFQYWVVDLNEESAYTYDAEKATLKLI